MKGLNNAPPRLSDLKPGPLRAALLSRAEGERERWLKAHEEAGLTFGEKLRRGVRGMIGRN